MSILQKWKRNIQLLLTHPDRNRVCHSVKQEQGSALVMVMFVVLILTVLGLAVLSATVGGAKRTETRENDVQSLHLAQKSLDETVAYITAQLDQKRNIDPVSLDADILNITQQVQNQINTDIKTSTDLQASGAGPSQARLMSIVYKGPEKGTTSQLTRYALTLTAQANVNGVIRTLVQEVNIDTFPEFLSYALGSEHNLILNGAPNVIGNIYAGNSLLTSRTARYTYKAANHTQSTQYPHLNGDAYVQSLDAIQEEKVMNQYTPINMDATLANDSLGRVLGISLEQVNIKNKKKFVQVNMDQTFIDKIAEAVSVNRNDIQTMYNSSNQNPAQLMTDVAKRYGIKQLTLPTKPATPVRPAVGAPSTEWDQYNAAVAAMQSYEEQMAKLKVTLATLDQSVVFNGDLELDGVTFNQLNYAQKAGKWFLLNGSLTIDNYQQSSINIRANMLTAGNVTIHGEADLDATIYVMKTPSNATDYTTVLQDATIKGLNGKEVVLLSKGGILLNRIEAFSSTPTTIKGFFYTEAAADLYGVGSVFWLDGGFFAKGDLTVNAVVGDAVGGASDIEVNPSSNVGSRFRVTYNESVYADQQAGLPRIQQVNVRVGKLELK
ncbi:hypothetical protein QCD85_05130 [Paenibacillus sp. PsM32]|uniref:hypothetical protein n=1 Tax=Paenibacillus sp. PsM32 TaxID=3030536 RepID=UPI00263B0ED3|nr:hypothetical protein [Paenibacillus sp. PsM32]MDN4617468.1 hypothetical protein [Paenibacillus sp. PsM32]